MRKYRGWDLCNKIEVNFFIMRSKKEKSKLHYNVLAEKKKYVSKYGMNMKNLLTYLCRKSDG